MSTSTIPFTPQAAMRITSMAILGYDFIITVPSEIRLYKRQTSMKRPSIACLLFMIARYIGLIYSCWVTAFFFNTNWTGESCSSLAPIGALLRGLVSSTSASVFVWRTWAIWGKPRWILIVMGIVLIPTTFFSYVPGLAQKGVHNGGGCIAVSRGNGPLSAKWTFALVNLLFDTLACVLGTIKLVMNRRNGQSVVSNILLADGLLYYVIAVGVQATNLAFLLSPDTTKQGTFLTFQTVTTTILAQRIITSLSERTSTVATNSNQDSTTGGRDRSGSRSLSAFGRTQKPNPMPIRTFQRDGQEVEMVKVEVNVASHVHTDTESANGAESDDRKVMYTN